MSSATNVEYLETLLYNIVEYSSALDGVRLFNSSSCVTSHLADSKQWKTIMDNEHDRAAADIVDQLNQK